MKGDFTRYTFRQEKHYSGVRMQQGRVQLDSDWNEFVDIREHLQRTGASDVIGRCGIPKNGGGFGIGTVPGDKDLSISSGKIYVDGMLCELEAAQIQAKFPASSSNNQVQIPVLTADGTEFRAGQWVEISGSASNIQKIVLQITNIDRSKGILTLNETIPSVLINDKAPVLCRIRTYTTQLDYFPSASIDPGRYLLYLDVWQRHITFLEDPEILEDALGGIDTTTRTKTIWQAKLHPCSHGENCESFGPEWVPDEAMSTGRLAAKAKSDSGSQKPCVLSARAGYNRLENQLYRVEIHNDKKSGKPIFKWSRDNGSVVTSWKDVLGDRLIVSNTGYDNSPGFAGGPWVELTDDPRELHGRPGILVKLTGKIEGDELEFDRSTIKDPDNPSLQTIDINNFKSNPKVRRWDGFNNVSVPSANEGWILLDDDGVEIKFEDGKIYQTGDYWLIPVRTARRDDDSGGVLWPKDTLTGQPLFEYRHGIEHHYCPLAICVQKNPSSGSGWAAPINCAPTFLPLTEIKIPDPQPQVQTEKGCCTITVGSGANYTLEDALDKLANSDKLKNMCICLLPGEHTLKKSVKIAGKPETPLVLKIKGCGKSSSINLEAGNQVSIEGVDLIILEDLEIHSSGGKKNSIMMFLRKCGEIIISSCGMRYSNELGRMLEIREANSVRIEKCVLDASYRSSLNVFENVAGRVVKTHKDVFGSVEELKSAAGIGELFRPTEKYSFVARAKPVATKIADLDKEKRVSLANDFNLAVNEAIIEMEHQGIKVSEEEKRTYAKFGAHLSLSGIADIGTKEVKAEEAYAVSKLIGSIYKGVSRSVPGIALIISDIAEEAVLEDNRITGTLSLYEGIPVKPGQEIKVNLGVFKEDLSIDHSSDNSIYVVDLAKLIGFAGTKSVMQMRGNRITDISLGNSIINAVNNRVYRPRTIPGAEIRTELNIAIAARGDQGNIGNVFHQIFMTNNVIEGGYHQLLAEHISLTSNRFDAGSWAQETGEAPKPKVSGYIVAIARSTMYIGNSGNTNTERIRLVSNSQVKNRQTDDTNTMEIIEAPVLK